MNDSTRLAVQPEVSEFVAQVRARLADLTEEEREELVGGLEADLAERLADVGSDGLAGVGGLGDPAAYAAELRAAAGLGIRPGRPRTPRRPLGEETDDLLDAARLKWNRVVAGHDRSARAWESLWTLRPAWWALRAWAAVQLLDWSVGPNEYATVLPTLGAPLIGPVVLVAAVWGSVELGRGRWWPEVLRPLRGGWRVTMLGLNLVAVVVLLALSGHFPDAWTSHALADGAIFQGRTAPEGHGLRSDGRFVRNVFAYDASGRPLTGVQLYDAKGRPLAVSDDRYRHSYRLDGSTVWTYPWFNGSQPLRNVFPLPVRARNAGLGSDAATAWQSTRPPVLPEAPLAVVPPVSLPTPSATPSVTATASRPQHPSARSSARPSARPSARSSARPSVRPSARRSAQ